MSLEAWGDEGDVGIDGYVPEGLYEENKQTLREAVELLRGALLSVKIRITYAEALGDPEESAAMATFAAKVDAWLSANTVDGKVP